MPKPKKRHEKPAPAMHIEFVRLSKILAAKRNPKKHDAAQMDASVRRFGFADPPVLDERSGALVEGHGRVEALQRMKAAGGAPPLRIQVAKDGEWLVPIVRGVRFDNAKEAEAYLLAHNAIGAGLWDDDLARILAEHDDHTGLGWSDPDIARIIKAAEDNARADGPALQDRFIVPPFSVLDTKQGYWQERKRRWTAIGIQSEIGRKDNLLKMSDTMLAHQKGGTSIFDPVLCELAYRWFSPPAGAVLDPFAGGSVRGIVAGVLGRSYLGVDLRAEQVVENAKQWKKIAKTSPRVVQWMAGDSRALITPALGSFDFVFSCPPYADLEQYSEDPADLSAMEYDAFLAAYREIIAASIKQLKPDRFACFVVGDVRDPRGLYRGLPSATIAAFEAAGARLYNEALLLAPIGTLAMRAGRTFSASRKLGKAHQQVLVFVKGDPMKAAKDCGEIEVSLEEISE